MTTNKNRTSGRVDTFIRYVTSNENTEETRRGEMCKTRDSSLNSSFNNKLAHKSLLGILKRNNI